MNSTLNLAFFRTGGIWEHRIELVRGMESVELAVSENLPLGMMFQELVEEGEGRYLLFGQDAGAVYSGVIQVIDKKELELDYAVRLGPSDSGFRIIKYLQSTPRRLFFSSDPIELSTALKIESEGSETRIMASLAGVGQAESNRSTLAISTEDVSGAATGSLGDRQRLDRGSPRSLRFGCRIRLDFQGLSPENAQRPDLAG